LSPSTAAYDAGEKFEHYQQIPSLHEFVLVATDRRVVEVRRRTDSGRWDTTRAEAGAVVSLTSISSQLDVNELYTMASDPA
jgi:Uma2 family endonuclease